MRTLGQFYREKIVGRNDLLTREFPDYRGESEIVKDLFGWKLYSGKNYIECRSKEEARFLQIYFDAGMTDVSVPADNEYLKSILPDLEYLKTEIDKIIGHYVDGVFNRKIRERIRHEVYQEIIK
jgi:hypothetical protein